MEYLCWAKHLCWNGARNTTLPLLCLCSEEKCALMNWCFSYIPLTIVRAWIGIGGGKKDEEFPKPISKDILIFYPPNPIDLTLPSYMPNTHLKIPFLR